MNWKSFPLGIIGLVLATGGGITYSLWPDQLWAVTIAELVALICLSAFLVLHFETVKSFSGRRSTKMGLNSILMVFLFVAILGIVNLLGYKHSIR